MKKKPNVLWLMSDQHNAKCAGYRQHPHVRTPNLDRIAAKGIDFTNAFVNNPICSPSRICFITGQYMHTHGISGNYNFDYPKANPNTLSAQFRRYGYQTALIGKSHMIGGWDSEGFEHIRYCDLIDSDRRDPLTNHYFNYLHDLGLSDFYEEGTVKSGQAYANDGSGPAKLPYEHSVERFTGRETLDFLNKRDETRPFFIHMSFQRPHAPIAPAFEDFNLYNPEDITLPKSSVDYYDHKFAGKPSSLREKLANGCNYPLADPNKDRLKRCLASYYALISVIDKEIGLVLDQLEAMGELDNTIILYTADHGDFAGEHGLFHKNLGIYDSIQNIPFLLSYPGSPEGVQDDHLVESIDFFPTICQLCQVPVPNTVEGTDLGPMIQGLTEGKKAAYCEWDFGKDRISAIRTKDYRLVVYKNSSEGELYDHTKDPDELENLWEHPDYAHCKSRLLQELLQFSMTYPTETNYDYDTSHQYLDRFTPGQLVQFSQVYWSTLTEAYANKGTWPPIKEKPAVN